MFCIQPQQQPKKNHLKKQMELGLSLGGGGGETTTPTTSTKPFPYFGKTTKKMNNNGLGFCMSLGGHHNSNGSSSSSTTESDQEERRSASSSDHHHHHHHPPLQLGLLPFSPAVSGHHHHHQQQQPSSQLRLPWLRTTNLTPEPGSIHKLGKGLDVNRLPTAAAVVVEEEEEEEEGEEGTALSSPNSTIVSSFQMDFSMYRSNGRNNNNNHKRDHIETISDHNNNINEGDEIGERGCSRGSDDEENGLTRKKLRLSKDQSAFLEESFKEHNTLNPKQKLALARELNLRPRQVEVWFQNRRARTKLKQTEVDCEYLKRCCETLTEENRRLQKELQELKVLKTSQPFYMQLPATTLTMCPSCERVATTTTSSTTTSPAAATTSGKTTTSSSNAALALAKSRLYPFITHAQKAQAQAQAHQAAS